MKSCRALLLVAGLSAALLHVGLPRAQGPQERPAGLTAERICDGPLLFGVSIGPVIPFALYDSGQWTNIWPKIYSSSIADRKSRYSPDRLGQRLIRTLGQTGRLPAQWWFMPLEGEPKPIEVKEVFWLETHCTWNWALRTEVPLVPPQCKDCCPEPVAGIVSNSRCFGRPFKRVPPGSSLAASILSELRARFEAEESRQIARLVEDYGSSSGFPLEAGERRVTPFKDVSVWQTPPRSGTPTLIYLRAVREYPEPECVSPSVFSAWLRQEEGAPPSAVELRVELTDCDYKGASRIRPVTTVQVGSGEFVIVESGAWEGLEYEVLEVTSASVTTKVSTWTSDF
ncbi:MAG: hypothetical protein P8Z74_12425 [Acidobacteriota bacterium]